jgi:hypothetical protein
VLPVLADIRAGWLEEPFACNEIDAAGLVHAPTGAGLGAADRFRSHRAQDGRGAGLMHAPRD